MLITPPARVSLRLSPPSVYRRHVAVRWGSGFAGKYSARRVRYLACGSAWLAWSGFALAAAQAPTTTPALELSWRAPQSCPQQAYVLAQVHAHLQATPPAGQGAQVDADVVRAGDRYRLELSIRGPLGDVARRSLDAGTCSALADAAGLLIALALAPTPAPAPGAPAQVADDRMPPSDTASADTLHEGPGPLEATPAGVSDARTRSDAGSARRQAAAPEARSHAAVGGAGRDVGLELGVGFELGFGVLPQTPALGLNAVLALQLGRLRAAAGVTRWLPGQTAGEGYPGASIRAQAVVGRAVVGFDVLESPLHVWPAAAFEYGRQSVETLGVSAPTHRSTGWLAAGAGAHAAWDLGADFALGLDAYVLGAWLRPRGLLQTERGATILFVAEPVSVRLALEIAYVFN